MASVSFGLNQLKSEIQIKAPVEVCYQGWLDSPRMPEVMRRVLDFHSQPLNVEPVTSADEIQAQIRSLVRNDIPLSRIKHWLFSGPGGKLYQFENTAILEIPNRFYCTTSTDSNDLSMQSSLLFSPEGMNTSTLVEWQVSFWASHKNGSATQLASDILTTGDSFLEDCLLDFKRYIESK